MSFWKIFVIMNETLVATSLTHSAVNSAVNQTSSSFSVLNFLPDSSFTHTLVGLNHHMGASLATILPHKWFLLPLIYDPVPTLIVMFVIAFVFTMFLDFLRHAWKIPFAMIVDIFDIMGMSMPFFNLLAIAGSIVVFSLLARNASRFWRTGFIAAGVVKAVIPGFSLIPVNTILMFISTVL